MRGRNLVLRRSDGRVDGFENKNSAGSRRPPELNTTVTFVTDETSFPPNNQRTGTRTKPPNEFTEEPRRIGLKNSIELYGSVDTEFMICRG